MQIHLKQINHQETTDTHSLYVCRSTQAALPGQTLYLGEQEIEILHCREHSHEYQWLIQTSKNLSLATEVQGELAGTAISFNPTVPIYLFAESKGISMALHWLDKLRQTVGDKQCRKLIHAVILYTPKQFSFKPTPTTFILPNFPSDMIAAVPLLEDLGIPSRLCAASFQPGCFEGNLVDLMQASDWSGTDINWMGILSQTKTAEKISAVLGEADFLKITN